MESILQIEGVSKSFGDRMLFADVTLGVGEGEKIGLIAKNGAGKSTLMKVIAGVEPADEGRIVFRNGVRMGYLEQTQDMNPDMAVIDVFLGDGSKAATVIKRYEKAVADNDADALAASMAEMDAGDLWNYESRFKQVLAQLKIYDYYQRVGELSGGQLKRVALAKVIIDEPDLLLLDEPTNHLDVDVIEWLEDYLSRSRMTLLMVTHDRYFLDRVCNKIVEIDNGYVYEYRGNYSYYLEKRQERIDAENAEVARAKNLLRTELEWMRRQPQARGGKARYRINAFYELEKRARSARNERDVELDVESSYIGSKIFVAHDVCKRFGDKTILNGFNYTFARYEKLGIVGNNGVGKSSFIKCLLGLEPLDSGYFEVGETVQFGYYSQEGIAFDESKKVIDAVREIAEHVRFDEKTSYTASQFLQLFLFSPADQQKFIFKLSGGEKRRLYLATVLMRKPNFLILDEPTNDLDIKTLEVLENYLFNFGGCVIIVSHDRFFMDRTVDHLFVFEGDGVIRDFPGNYSDYREAKDEEERTENARQKEAAKQKEKAAQQPRPRATNKMTFKERKEFEALESEIAQLSAEKASLDALFNGGEVIDDVAGKSSRYEEIGRLLDEKEMRWLELSEKE